jgi:hypothetical protein
MPNQRRGYVGQYKDGRWFARVTVTDEDGRRRNVVRRAQDKSEAREILKSLLRQLDDEGTRVVDFSRLTFTDLADFYERGYLQEAVYVDGQKVSGLRDVARPKELLKHFRAFFGRMKLREITYGHLLSYRDSRFKVQTAAPARKLEQGRGRTSAHPQHRLSAGLAA